MVTIEGQKYLAEVGLGGGTPEANWYVALWADPVTPLETWTAATFPALAGEIIDPTGEGYAGDRPLWIPNAPFEEPTSNSDSPASYTIITGSSLTIRGSALLSSPTRGGTSGILLAAITFDGGDRTQFNGDVFDNVFEVELVPQ